MIDWACDENVLITFDKEPIVQVRTIKPNMSKLDLLSFKKYPFTCKKSLKVMIYDNKKFKQYKFEIKENYCWNGSDIPRVFWRLVGSKSEPQYLIASCIHDVICENHQYIDDDRRLSSMIFRALLIEAGVNKFKANIMAESVDLFQRVVGKWGK